ncbi:hypothetical protein CAPI_09395 [Corynebacterium capitovis DSM 44611]|uniref:HdeD family acid-resistance protein n=1 Tax=Corynebacterium capitovis TaxID=131081 RepID=UPI00036BA588|nr:DUF308 domain-containing protein [Corynebacterium capitovis]WKD58402.1 hypothetical protein CAPI_09395 [Corynebacterium capitovis DSM 44611]
MSTPSATPPPNQSFYQRRVSDAQHSLKVLGNVSVAWLIFRGVIALLFGILVLASPLSATVALPPVVGILFSLWLIFGGIAQIVFAFRERDVVSGWGWDAFFGVLELIIGILLFFVPIETGIFLVLFSLWVMAFVVIFRAIPMFSSGNGWLIFLGIVNMIFGVLMVYFVIARPGESLVAAVLVAGIWGVVSGVLSFALAWQVNRVRNDLEAAAAETGM